jgi:hypothetical protein
MNQGEREEEVLYTKLVGMYQAPHTPGSGVGPVQLFFLSFSMLFLFYFKK